MSVPASDAAYMEEVDIRYSPTERIVFNNNRKPTLQEKLAKAKDVDSVQTTGANRFCALRKGVHPVVKNILNPFSENSFCWAVSHTPSFASFFQAVSTR